MFTNTINAIKGYIEAFIAFVAALLRMLGMDEMASQIEEYTI